VAGLLKKGFICEADGGALSLSASGLEYYKKHLKKSN
jgi:hypothetical protein